MLDQADNEYIKEEDRIMTIETEYNIGDEMVSCIETLIEAGYFYEEYLEE